MRRIIFPESTTEIKDLDVLRDYIHGGKGVIMLESPSKASHNYMFSKPANESDFPDDYIFVYAVHDNKRFYVGLMESDKFRLTKNSRFLEDTDIVKGAKYIVNLMNNENKFNQRKMTLYHCGCCARCGRELTSAESRSRGFGKKCYKKFEASMSDHNEIPERI